MKWRFRARVIASTALLLVLLSIAAIASAATFTGEQQRISQQGPDGDDEFNALDPAVAYNPSANQYLVVWEGDDTAPLVNGETEVWGRLASPGGAPVGDRFRISDMGPDGNQNLDAQDPAVAYNSLANEFLVVWEGDDDTAPLVEGENEIFGQRLNAAGTATGANDFRISDMGPNGNSTFDANDPKLAFDPAANGYLVVWEGDDDTAPLVEDENEIFGQLLDGGGAETGTNDFQISATGPNGNDDFDAVDPGLAHNPVAGEFMAIWEADDDTAPQVEGENEIFGQRLSAAGAETGVDDFRISDMGPGGNDDFDATDPELVANSATGEYLAVWQGEDDTAPLVEDEFEIFGQRLSAGGADLGADDFRISDLPPSGNTAFDAGGGAIAYSAATNSYLVAWEADTHSAEHTQDENEIYSQRLSAAGELDGEAFQVSQIGTPANPDQSASSAAIAAGPDEFLVAFDGIPGPPLGAFEAEIFARGVAAAEPAPVPPDTEVTVEIAGKKLKLSRKRQVTVRVACPAAEQSPPCAGELALRTRGKVEVAAKRRLTYGKRQFEAGAGETAKLKLKLSKKHARLVRSSKAARKVRATATVADAVGNSAKVTKKMKLVPAKRKRS